MDFASGHAEPPVSPGRRCGPEDTTSLRRNPSLTVEIDPNHFTSSSLHELLRAFPTISHLRLSLSTAVFHHHPMSLDDTFLTLFYPPQNFLPGVDQLRGVPLDFRTPLPWPLSEHA
jgi:hypothetical protein